MLDICLKLLDENPKYSSDADADCSGRRNPVYVTRVICAMVSVSTEVPGYGCAQTKHQALLTAIHQYKKVMILSLCVRSTVMMTKVC